MKSKNYILLKNIEILTIFSIFIIWSIFTLLKTTNPMISLAVFLFFPLILVCVIDVKFGLLLALCSMYNPYYAFISNTQIWSNAAIRAYISVYFIIILCLGVLINMKLNRLVIGSFEKKIFIFLLILIIGTWYGIFCGNNINYILVDLFPFLEFIVYYLLTFIILENSKEIEIKRLFKYLLLWCNFIVLFELLMYIIFNRQFAYQLYMSGFRVKRIMDFMLIFTWTSLLVSIKVNFWKNSKIKFYIQISLLLCLIAIFLSFTRSIWLAVLINSFFIIQLFRKSEKRRYKKIFSLLLKFIVLLFSLLIIDNVFNLGLLKLVTKLLIARIVEQPLYSSLGVSFDFFRIMHLKSQFKEIVTHPLLGKGMGGTFWALYGDIGPLKEGWTSQVFNIYIRVIFKLGIIGFSIFLIVIFDIWRKSKRYFNITKTLIGKMISGIIIGLMIGYGITFLFFTPILHFPIMVYFGFLLGILRTLSKYEKTKNCHVYS